MNIKLDKFDSGWIGLSIALHSRDIDLLLHRLTQLQSGEIKHFHLRNDDFGAEEGVADVEITTIRQGEEDNMSVE